MPHTKSVIVIWPVDDGNYFDLAFVVSTHQQTSFGACDTGKIKNSQALLVDKQTQGWQIIVKGYIYFCQSDHIPYFVGANYFGRLTATTINLVP